MALLTLAEAKAFLGISTGTTNHDALIGTYIPLIENDICDYCNNWFQDKAIFVEYSGGLAFVGTCSSRDFITDDSQNFTTAGLSSGMDIAIDGGSNYGIRNISTGQTSAVLNIGTTSNKVFVDQDQDASHNTVGTIRISRIDWPSNLKPTAAKMIWYQIDNSKPTGAISEKIDDYSITYAGARAYPQQLVTQLDNFKNLRSH